MGEAWNFCNAPQHGCSGGRGVANFMSRLMKLYEHKILTHLYVLNGCHVTKCHVPCIMDDAQLVRRCVSRPPAVTSGVKRHARNSARNAATRSLLDSFSPTLPPYLCFEVPESARILPPDLRVAAARRIHRTAHSDRASTNAQLKGCDGVWCKRGAAGVLDRSSGSS